jgi:hypothetical protein
MVNINGTREFGPAPLADVKDEITVTMTRWSQPDRFLQVDGYISLDDGANWVMLISGSYAGGPASTKPGASSGDIVFHCMTPMGAARQVKAIATSTGGIVSTDVTVT